MFNPTTGDILICDNDNVGINRQSECQVWGTMEYMAPELVKAETKPSTDTDLHSLAVLLFNLWVWHHPLHGMKEFSVRSWDLPAKHKIYGLEPVFVFDPNDKNNELPNDPAYSTARQRWGFCPKSLQELFTRAFTTGLREPARRVTEGEWKNLFLKLQDSIAICSYDKAENFWNPGISTTRCWYCQKEVSIPAKLEFTQPTGKHHLLLNRETQLLRRHIDPGSWEGWAVIGQVVQNPANPDVWGIKNLTPTPWTATFTDGSLKEIPPDRAAPLNAGLKLNINGVMSEIVP